MNGRKCSDTPQKKGENKIYFHSLFIKLLDFMLIIFYVLHYREITYATI